MIGEPLTKALLISLAPTLWPQCATHVLSNQNFRDTIDLPITRWNALHDIKPWCVHALSYGCVQEGKCTISKLARQLSHIAGQPVVLHFTKKPMNDWSDRWDRVWNNADTIKRGQACWTVQNCPDVTKVEPKWKRERSGVCTHSPPGALEEHPGLSEPALQMSSPGTARLDPIYHSLPSSSLLAASPHSSSLTPHEKNSCMPGEIRL